ncbi:MAG TPA: TonB-dependent receptor [Dinghuibacter sp.]|uniref:SusC/RagA family TonB-linked outer membrane protein n=1 Tax=Dinghuibacter sp. TaxID=2024697 RepID=UPI002CF7857C|nr:TonB-dependent receptor [Dinghuibacter sp.]HTJ13952.1 TonB-dependent receptor [Dinghuibacter sp.]
MNKKLCILAALLCAAFLTVIPRAGAQTTKTVHGHVVDGTSNQPLAGASIHLKGATKGTTTDENGDFTLAIPATGNPVLVFSGAGYPEKEIPVGRNEMFSVKLEHNAGDLNEVIVTAYTTEKKKDLTGSVAVVNVGDMTKQPNGLVTNLLQGQAAGLTVIGSGQPGEDPQIRIRGINTFGNNIPLYVVDGVPTQNISDVNPLDIASVQVLKDAGAAAIYGSRASNGVIILTTKAGHGKLTVHYDGYFGEQVPKGGNPWHLLDPQDQANYEWQAKENINPGVVPSDPLFGSGPTPVLPDYIAPLGAKAGDPSTNPALYYVDPNYTNPAELNSFYRITKANKTGQDWFHSIFRTAPITSHNLSVSGGEDRVSYLFSLNYFDQDGALIDTYLKRYTVRSNVRFDVSKHIRIGEDMAYSITQDPTKVNVINQYAGGSPIFEAMVMPTIIPVYDIKGNYAGTYGTPNYTDPNPVAAMDRSRTNTEMNNRLFGSVYANVSFLKYFALQTTFGGEDATSRSASFTYPTYENAQNQSTNAYSQYSDATNDWTWTNTLTFNGTFAKDHTIKLLLGTEAYQYRYENMSASRQGYFSFDPNYTTLSSGTGTQTVAGGRSKQSLSSYFGRLDYSFRDKYLISGTIREDGSSVFINGGYSWFPSVSAAWRISQEKFLQQVSWLTDLKIRGSWGILGNQLNVNPDNAYTTYLSNNASSYYDIDNTNSSILPGLMAGQIGNPVATWEKDINSNIGFDATFLKGKLDVTADWYKKVISGLLYNPPLLGTQGAGTAPYVNVARMNNTGLDVSISGRTSITKDWRLSGSLNVTTYHNVIEKVSNNANYFVTADKRQFGDYFIRNQVGHSVGSFYGYKITGFWNDSTSIVAANAAAAKATNNPAQNYQAGARPGYFRYADENGDGVITPDDRTIIGDPNPKFTYGLNLDIHYKNLDLALFFYGVHGNQIWNDALAYTDLSGLSYNALYNHWTPANHNAKAPLPGTYTSYAGDANSYFLENGAYLKLKNIQLGYTIPQNRLKPMGIQSLRVYVQAANLFTITKYTGLDPEVSGSVTDFGVDEAIYPNMKQFLLGVNLAF